MPGNGQTGPGSRLERRLHIEKTGEKPMSSSANSFNAVKIFSTTLARDREQMGEMITQWIKENPGIEIVDRTVTQSSDKEFHCLTITIFYRTK